MIIIYGAGRSGRALKMLLPDAILYDDKTQCDMTLDEVLHLSNVTHVIVSPVIGYNNPICNHFRSMGAKIIGELEYALGRTKGKIVAVTGTNGKTTVCQMISHILNVAKINNYLAGNIGIPLSVVCDKTTEDDIVVLECSSYQLENFVTFAPYISVVTNFDIDHLDRHKSIVEYHRAKANIFAHQNSDCFAVLNGEDCYVQKWSEISTATKIYYGRNCQCYYDTNSIYFDNSIFRLQKNTKRHNIMNTMCAVVVSKLLNIDDSTIQKGIDTFVYDHHRIEYIGSIGGVSFVDDSKATNISSAIASVNSFDNVYLIMGGSDKGYEFDEFFVKCRPSYIAVVGQTSDKIMSASQRCMYKQIEKFYSMYDAVHSCYHKAIIHGGVVLLAPACASFDMYTSYEQRGNDFANIAKQIINGNKPL